MSFSFGVPVSLSQLLPTQRNLHELLEKLVTVFGVEWISKGGVLPSQPLQREFGNVRRYILQPMVGNDFHVQTSFGTSPSWKALLQLDQDDESDKICFLLCDVAQHPGLEEATATESADWWPVVSAPPGRMRMSLFSQNVASSGYPLLILKCRITNFSDGLLQRISTLSAKGAP